MKIFVCKINVISLTLILIILAVISAGCSGDGATGILPANSSSSYVEETPTVSPAAGTERVVVSGKIVAPPGGGIYTGAYNQGNNGVETFEDIIGKKVAIANPYPVNDGGTENTWPSFDRDGHEKNRKEGYVTWTGIETSLGKEEPKFIPQDVIDGKIDDYLEKMAEDIKDWGGPIFWMYPQEPGNKPGAGYDGGGYGPAGDLTEEETAIKGYSKTEEYGDPAKPDGPERYVHMCRHIHDVMAPVAPNITWVMGAIASRETGAYTQWYPGDDYVDWHALNLYTGIKQEDNKGKFADIIEPAWSEALALNPDKPFMLVEFGVYATENDEKNSEPEEVQASEKDSHGKDRSLWFKEFFEAAKTTHKELGAFIYWQSIGSGCEILSDDPCGDDWADEMKGPDKSRWHSDVITESTGNEEE